MNYEQVKTSLDDAKEAFNYLLNVKEKFKGEPQLLDFYLPSAEFMFECLLRNIVLELRAELATKNTYRYYEGGLYKVLDYAYEEATGKRVVIYQGEDGRTWTRHHDTFFEQVEYEGAVVPRFEKL